MVSDNVTYRNLFSQRAIGENSPLRIPTPQVLCQHFRRAESVTNLPVGYAICTCSTSDTGGYSSSLCTRRYGPLPPTGLMNLPGLCKTPPNGGIMPGPEWVGWPTE